MAEQIVKSERPTSAVAVLRRSTKRLHQDLHVHPLLRDLVSDELTISSYRRIIEAFYGFYQPLEPRVIAAATKMSCLAEYDHAIRTSWLEQDLVCLGYSMADIANLACYEEFPPLSTRGSLAGCLYVIQGSTLGGATVVGSLAKNEKLKAVRAAHFFRGYGERTIPSWQHACRFIESTCHSMTETHAAIESARCVFLHLERWLTVVAANPSDFASHELIQ